MLIIIDEGITLLEEWLNAPKNSKPTIPSALKTQVRKKPGYLPEAYTTSVDLTIEMLTTESGNSVCIHHDLKDRVTVHVDGSGPGGIKIHGVPVSRSMKGKKKNQPDQVKGHFSCGCVIKTAVIGALLWKSWKISSLLDGMLVTEGFDSQVLSPRNILFIIQNLQRLWGINLEDMFTGSVAADRSEVEKKMMEKALSHMGSVYYETYGLKVTIET